MHLGWAFKALSTRRQSKKKKNLRKVFQIAADEATATIESVRDAEVSSTLDGATYPWKPNSKSIVNKKKWGRAWQHSNVGALPTLSHALSRAGNPGTQPQTGWDFGSLPVWGWGHETYTRKSEAFHTLKGRTRHWCRAPRRRVCSAWHRTAQDHARGLLFHFLAPPFKNDGGAIAANDQPIRPPDRQQDWTIEGGGRKGVGKTKRAKWPRRGRCGHWAKKKMSIMQIT